LETIYKDGSQKIFYEKPYEPKFDILDRGCELQTIDQYSCVGRSDEAVVGLYHEGIHDRKQNSTTECNKNFDIEIISLDLEKGLRSCAEEVIILKGFISFFTIREVYILYSRNYEKRYKRRLMKMFIDSNFKFENLDCGCEDRIINQFSNVGRSDAAVVDLYHGAIHDRKQSSSTESNNCSEIGKICLISEKNPKVPLDLISSGSSYQEQNVISKMNRHCRWQTEDLAVVDFIRTSHRNNPIVESRVQYTDVKIKGITCMHEESAWYVG
jgi:hypothetical protein